MDISSGFYNSASGPNVLSLGGDIAALTRTDNTRKIAFVSVPAYNSSAVAGVGLLWMDNAVSTSDLFIGGGNGYYKAATHIGLYTAADTTTPAGTERLTILNNGNVGIGTTGPEGTLHIHKATAGTITPLDTGDDLVIENDTAVGISLFSPDANSKNIFFGSPTDNDFARIYGSYNSGSEYLRFNVMGNEVTINDAGNVGIGTTGPTYKLQVAGSVKAVSSGGTVQLDSSGNFIIDL
ncbi:MAG: hypothetical protein UX22_C0028G0017 [Candidatus Jorgensenbacteria bacterium GW2011_GWA2_45_9]|uniref:Uncharacterized protein n=1 Tax=Candidatus Jorgensenbacteria bacterium GW2011_GWA2_45_9 TaxID=1618663 RepID=A0A0G1N154_9BACT|nr:MAG: hypothetical protein UX22_C0028G0017 [Candidatus Jorgensenbacteria bacterium GW2011_GWA2_45_9]